MGRAAVPERQKIRIETLLKSGQTQRIGASKLGVSQSCVKNVANKIKHRVPLINTSGQGRKDASTSRDDRLLLKLCKKDRTKSSRQLASEWVLSSGKTMAACTVRRRLLKTGYESYTAKRKPYRTVAQKQRRFEFANYYMN